MNPPPRTLGVQSKFRTLIKKKKKKEEARIQRESTFLLRCYCNARRESKVWIICLTDRVYTGVIQYCKRKYYKNLVD